MPLNGEQCEAKMKILEYFNDVKEELYANDRDHTHDSIGSNRLSPEDKNFVMSMYTEGYFEIKIVRSMRNF